MITPSKIFNGQILKNLTQETFLGNKVNFLVTTTALPISPKWGFVGSSEKKVCVYFLERCHEIHFYIIIHSRFKRVYTFYKSHFVLSRDIKL